MEITHKESRYTTVREEVNSLEEAIAQERSAIEALDRILNQDHTEETSQETISRDLTSSTSSSNVTPAGNQT